MKSFDFDQIVDEEGKTAFRSCHISGIGSQPSQNKVAKFSVKMKKRGISLLKHFTYVSKANELLRAELYGE